MRTYFEVYTSKMDFFMVVFYELLLFACFLINSKHTSLKLEPYL